MSVTAILVFARSAILESGLKPLTSIKKSDEKVYARLNKRVEKLALKSGLPYFIHTEHYQIGDNFGARISNAVAKVFELGYDKIIILGNDCPQLSNAHIITAIKELENKQLVIGPDINGGAYLIGLNKAIFKQDTFENLKWQTSELCSNIQTLDNFALLPVLHDVNKIKDVQKVIKHLSFYSKLRSELLSLLKITCKSFLSFLLNIKHANVFKYFSLRAPPCVQ